MAIGYVKAERPPGPGERKDGVVRLLRTVETGGAVIPTGTKFVVWYEDDEGGLALVQPTCKCCGVRATLHNVSPRDVEFIEEQDHE